MRVRSQADIDFSDGSSISIESLSIGTSAVRNNAILSIKVNEELSAVNKNPLGALAYSNLVLKLQTPDKSLMPENTGSPHYGYMDSSAIIRVQLVTDTGDVNFGTFFVDRWYTNISSDERKTVTIEASGYMKTITKMTMPSMQIRKEQRVSDYILEVINKQNERLTDRYKIQVDENISFGEFDTMEFSDIEASTLGDALQEVSQSTLTNIYVDRDNMLKTDYCFDDTATGNEYVLGDCINIRNIKVGDGGLSDYSGVEVKYNNHLVNNVVSIAQLSGQRLSVGETEISGINSNNKIFKLMYVSIESDSEQYIKINKLQYDKNKISIVIENTSTEEVEATITFWGQSLNDNQITLDRYIANKKGTALQVTNNILGVRDIGNFANKLLQLISIKNSTVEAKGWFDPTVKLGDIVYLDAEKTVNTKGYYKVIGLNWQIESSIQCVMKLIKMVS